MKKSYKVKSNKYKRKNKQKRCIALCIAGVILVGGGVLVKCEEKLIPKSYIKDTSCKDGSIKIPICTVSTSSGHLLSQSATEIEVKLKELAEKREREKLYVGTNEEGKAYAYDAQIIADKLSHYDYSNNGQKIVFLTFDDGTSTTVTPDVLKVLDDYGVKATFFLVGSNIEDGGERAKALVKQIFDKGHAIANHSYTHNYRNLYPGRSLNLDNFVAEYDKNEALIKDILGVNFKTRVFRCPGGHMSWDNMEPLDAYLLNENKFSIDWNALTKDAEGPKKNAAELVEQAKETAEGKEIVVLLMHDTYGKEETAKALPEIIEYFKANGYEFKTLV